jgi:anti-sigma factor RsiW
VSGDTELLLRYLDGELSPEEARAFRARLVENPALSCQLQEMRRVGALLRVWADEVGCRAEDLVEPTLQRVRRFEQKRARHATLGMALAAVLVALALPRSSVTPHGPLLLPRLEAHGTRGAAIERIEARDKHAQVFLVGNGSTPVVWLADDVEADDQQDPG